VPLLIDTNQLEYALLYELADLPLLNYSSLASYQRYLCQYANDATVEAACSVSVDEAS
jgi:hypothetical protein